MVGYKVISVKRTKRGEVYRLIKKTEGNPNEGVPGPVGLPQGEHASESVNISHAPPETEDAESDEKNLRGERSEHRYADLNGERPF